MSHFTTVVGISQNADKSSAFYYVIDTVQTHGISSMANMSPASFDGYDFGGRTYNKEYDAIVFYSDISFRTGNLANDNATAINYVINNLQAANFVMSDWETYLQSLVPNGAPLHLNNSSTSGDEHWLWYDLAVAGTGNSGIASNYYDSDWVYQPGATFLTPTATSFADDVENEINNDPTTFLKNLIIDGFTSGRHWQTIIQDKLLNKIN